MIENVFKVKLIFRFYVRSCAYYLFPFVVSLGFFDDIYIPAENLQKTSR